MGKKQETLCGKIAKVLKLLVSIPILLLILLPICLLCLVPLLVHRSICKFYIYLRSLDVLLVPLGSESFVAKCKLDIRFILEFDSQFNLQNFKARVREKLPERFKYCLGTFGFLPAFKSSSLNKFETESDLDAHFCNASCLGEEDFREQVESIAVNLDPLERRSSRPGWEFIVIPEKKKTGGRTCIIFRIDHTYADVLGAYVFLASLSDVQVASTDFYVNPFGKDEYFSRPHWIFAGWGFVKSTLVVLTGSRTGYKYKNVDKTAVNLSRMKLDLDKLRAIKQAVGSRMLPILIFAGCKSWLKNFRSEASRRKIMTGYNMARFGRSADNPINSLAACMLTVTLSKSGKKGLKEQLQNMEELLDDAKYTSLFGDFTVFVWGPFLPATLGFEWPPSDMLHYTTLPFTKSTVKIAGSELQFFYWFFKCNLIYTNFVTYADTMLCCISAPASLMTKEETIRFNRGIVDEIEKMYQEVMQEKESV